MSFHTFQGTIDPTGAATVTIQQPNVLVEWNIYQLSVAAPNPLTSQLLASIFINGSFLCNTPKAAQDTAAGNPNIILTRTDVLTVVFSQGIPGQQVSVNIWYDEVQAGTSSFGSTN